MKIGRFIKSSLYEWKGKNSCVIEVRGSAVRSPFLTSIELFEEEGPTIDESEILEFISKDSYNVEAVVISGGEPLLQKDLYPFLKKLKALKKPILLKTEGTCPDVLDDLVGACMFDRVCIKVCEKVNDSDTNGENILRSIEILNGYGEEYEVEITAVPGITNNGAVESVCRKIKGKGTVTLRKPEMKTEKEFKKKEILNLVDSAKKYVKKVELKGF